MQIAFIYAPFRTAACPAAVLNDRGTQVGIFLGIELCFMEVWGYWSRCWGACAGFTDARRSPDPEVDYSMADIGVSAFSLFFMQSGFLSYQRRLEKGHGTSNCHTLFGMKKIPTDNYIRLMLDPVSPEALQQIGRAHV